MAHLPIGAGAQILTGLIRALLGAPAALPPGLKIGADLAEFAHGRWMSARGAGPVSDGHQGVDGDHTLALSSHE